MTKLLELNATIQTPADLAEYLRAKSPIYQDHPKLAAEVAMVRLSEADIDTVHAACRILNTNVEGLMIFVENGCQQVEMEPKKVIESYKPLRPKCYLPKWFQPNCF